MYILKEEENKIMDKKIEKKLEESKRTITILVFI